MERAAWLERRFGAEIEWLPFDLHPEYPPEGLSFEQLEAKYNRDLRTGQAQMSTRRDCRMRRAPGSRTRVRR
jgi:predicted DsbA family dithiol-disulfide isomerase